MSQREDVVVAEPRRAEYVALEAPVVGVGGREGREVVRAGQRRRNSRARLQHRANQLEERDYRQLRQQHFGQQAGHQQR